MLPVLLLKYCLIFPFFLRFFLSFFKFLACHSLQNLVEESIWPMLAKESLKALRELGLLSLGGKYLLRRVFEVCIKLSKPETLQSHVVIWYAHTKSNIWIPGGCRSEELRSFCCSLPTDSCWDFTPNLEVGFQWHGVIYISQRWRIPDIDAIQIY